MFVETIKICLKATEHKSKRTYANLTGKTCKAFWDKQKKVRIKDSPMFLNGKVTMAIWKIWNTC